MRRKLVAGNWKMHGSLALTSELCEAVTAGKPYDVDVVVFPPTLYLRQAVLEVAGSGVGVGAQDVSVHAQDGAYTGEISARMIADCGAGWAIVGHSERRADFRESDHDVGRKFAAARKAGLTPVLCVGETHAEYTGGHTLEVIERQLAAVLEHNPIEAFVSAVIAYEPVWAIGSGLSATPEQAQHVHAFIRSQLGKKDANISLLTRLLYGGSVKAANAAELFAQPDVDGGLVGGASLNTEEFVKICRAAGT
ncbi:triose-phosphate isomerase [Frateuria aurantia]